MCPLPYKPGSDSISQVISQNRDTGTYHQVDVVKQTIDKANGISLSDVLHQYGIEFQGNKIRCPFSFHLNGQEKTPSFNYYPEQNRFYCYGCKSGGGPADFVALFENKSKYSAAQILLTNHLVSSAVPLIKENFQEEQAIHLEFSHSIREFFHLHSEDPQALTFAEEICNVFDKMQQKYELSSQDLKSLMYKLVKKLGRYKCQPL